MGRNSDVDYYTGDDSWEEVVAMLLCMVGIIGIFVYMYQIYKVDFTVWWTRALAFISGFIVYIYTVVLLIMGFISVVNVTRKLIRRKFRWKRFGALLSDVGFYWVGQVAINLLFWGIVKGNTTLLYWCIPAFAIVVASIVYLVYYLSNEV